MTFTTCGNGHDLTTPGAYVYYTNGNRDCRQCAYLKQSPQKQKKLGTWSDKRGEKR